MGTSSGLWGFLSWYERSPIFTMSPTKVKGSFISDIRKHFRYCPALQTTKPTSWLVGCESANRHIEPFCQTGFSPSLLVSTSYWRWNEHARDLDLYTGSIHLENKLLNPLGCVLPADVFKNLLWTLWMEHVRSPFNITGPKIFLILLAATAAAVPLHTIREGILNS